MNKKAFLQKQNESEAIYQNQLQLASALGDRFGRRLPGGIELHSTRPAGGLPRDDTVAMITHSDVPKNALNVEESSLRKLQYWLEYEKYTAILAGAAPWFYFIVIRILYLAAVVFTPYMLWHLYKAGWYKSIAIFVVTVLIPFLVFQFIQTESALLGFVLTFSTLFLFYFYTWILSYMIKNHLMELKELKIIKER